MHQTDLSATRSDMDGKGLRIGIVQARFNPSITAALAKACSDELHELRVAAEDIQYVQVPGALEVPVALQAMAQTGHFDALIALGCIIRGETYHFELVANESGSAITQLALDHGLPIANAILTTENEAQAIARQHDKGRDAARVAVEIVAVVSVKERLEHSSRHNRLTCACRSGQRKRVPVSVLVPAFASLL
jgi:6,7-dimethyl-8-ribityllumazine synthase